MATDMILILFFSLIQCVCAFDSLLGYLCTPLDNRPRFRAIAPRTAPGWLEHLPASKEKQLFLDRSQYAPCNLVVAEKLHAVHPHFGNALIFYLLEVIEEDSSVVLWGTLTNTSPAVEEVPFDVEIGIYKELKCRIGEYKSQATGRGGRFLDARQFMR